HGAAAQDRWCLEQPPDRPAGRTSLDATLLLVQQASHELEARGLSRARGAGAGDHPPGSARYRRDGEDRGLARVGEYEYTHRQGHAGSGRISRGLTSTRSPASGPRRSVTPNVPPTGVTSIGMSASPSSTQTQVEAPSMSTITAEDATAHTSTGSGSL